MTRRARRSGPRAVHRRPTALAPRLLPLLVTIALAASACTRSAQPSEAITVAIAAGPNSLDPRIGSDETSQRIHQLLFNSLVRLDDKLRVVPELATGWDTPDDRTYVVHLRRGVRFHDGSELDADDVVYTFGSFLDPSFVSPRKGAYRPLAAVVARDRYTVEFRLKEPFGSFPINLVMGIVPAGSRDVARHPIGTGPFRFVEALADDRVVVERFGDYFEGPARAARIVLKIVPDDTMRGLELRKGSVDLVVNDLSPDIVHQLEQEGRLRLARADGCDYAYLGLNLRDPLLADRRVRLALGYAIDRRAIVEHLRRGLAVPAVGILPPMSWAFEPDVFAFEHDPAKAKTLLDEAGYRDPDGDGPLPRFTLSLKVSTAEFVRLQAAVIQSNLREVGIDVDVRTYEFATLYADVLSGNFQTFTLQWVGVTDPDMLRRVFHTGQMPPTGFNRGFYSNREVDALIDRATRSTDEAGRARLYSLAQQRIAADVPYVSLWYKTNVAVYQPDLTGVTLSPNASFIFLKEVGRVRQATN